MTVRIVKGRTVGLEELRLTVDSLASNLTLKNRILSIEAAKPLELIPKKARISPIAHHLETKLELITGSYSKC
jgi:hypothetical protein